jgi:hypothetical protein
VAVGIRRLPIAFGPQAGDDLDAAVLHAPHGEDPIRHDLKLVRATAHHHDLEAKIVAEVHVQRRADALPELVLQVRQLLTEVTDMVIVDQGQGAHRLDALRHLRSADRGPGQIAQQLGAGARTLFRQRIELAEERAFNRDAEPDQGILHTSDATAPRPHSETSREIPQGCDSGRTSRATLPPRSATPS